MVIKVAEKFKEEKIKVKVIQDNMAKEPIHIQQNVMDLSGKSAKILPKFNEKAMKLIAKTLK